MYNNNNNNNNNNNKVIDSLNYTLWRRNMSKEIKLLIYNTIIKGIML